MLHRQTLRSCQPTVTVTELLHAYNPATQKMEVNVSFCPLVVRRRHSRGMGCFSLSVSNIHAMEQEFTSKTSMASKAQSNPPKIKMTRLASRQVAVSLNCISQNACTGMLRD